MNKSPKRAKPTKPTKASKERSWELGYKKLTDLVDRANMYTYTVPIEIIAQYKYTLILMKLANTKLNSYYLGIAAAIADWEAKNPDAKRPRKYNNQGVKRRKSDKYSRDTEKCRGYDEVTVNLPNLKGGGNGGTF